MHSAWHANEETNRQGQPVSRPHVTCGQDQCPILWAGPQGHTWDPQGT